jgi:DNA-binding transcriptional ArsR family regulator
MARAAAHSDVYNAIAEPRRRAILELVCSGERAVNEVAEVLEMDQPSVSKHLRVLREVDLVSVRRDGRQRLYSGTPDALRPVQEWAAECERIWTRHLDRIQRRAEGRSRRRNVKPERSEDGR